MRQIIFLLLFPFICFSQGTDIKLRGYIIDAESGQKLKEALIVNKTSGNFIYTDTSGNFSMNAKKTDEFVFSAQGYSGAELSFSDSTKKQVYTIVLKLNRYKIKIREVTVVAKKEVVTLKNELENITLDYKGKVYNANRLKNSFQSPITALYTRWNKRERSKSRLASIKYKDQLRLTLITLFNSGYLSEVEKLSPESRIQFAYYLTESDKELMFDTQYELLAFLNRECKLWSSLPRK